MHDRTPIVFVQYGSVILVLPKSVLFEVALIAESAPFDRVEAIAAATREYHHQKSRTFAFLGALMRCQYTVHEYQDA